MHSNVSVCSDRGQPKMLSTHNMYVKICEAVWQIQITRILDHGCIKWTTILNNSFINKEHWFQITQKMHNITEYCTQIIGLWAGPKSWW